MTLLVSLVLTMSVKCVMCISHVLMSSCPHVLIWCACMSHVLIWCACVVPCPYMVCLHVPCPYMVCLCCPMSLYGVLVLSHVLIWCACMSHVLIWCACVVPCPYMVCLHVPCPYMVCLYVPCSYMVCLCCPMSLYGVLVLSHVLIWCACVVPCPYMVCLCCPMSLYGVLVLSHVLSVCEMPEIHTELASNSELLRQLLCVSTSPTFEILRAQLVASIFLCCAHSPSVHGYLSRPEVLEGLMEACLYRASPGQLSSPIDLLLLK